MSHYQGGARPKRGLVGPMLFVGLLFGAALMFGVLMLVNHGLPFPVPTGTPTDTPQPVPTSSSSASLPSVDLTAPGSTLAFDTPATVSVTFADGKVAYLTLSAAQPQAASQQDLEILQKATPQLVGLSVYYQPVTVTKVAGDPIAGKSLTSVIYALNESGIALQQLTIADWKACSNTVLPDTIDQVGTAVPECFAAVAGTGAPGAVSTRFSQSGGSYDLAKQGAIVWGP